MQNIIESQLPLEVLIYAYKTDGFPMVNILLKKGNQ